MRVSIDSQFVNLHLGLADAGIALYILNVVQQAKTGADLVVGMKEIKEKFPGMGHFFLYGFGNSHMWVKQRCLQKETNNWITVYF